MRTPDTIRTLVNNMAADAVFSATDFLQVGSRAAVDQQLYRMAKTGEVVRVARGLYVRPDSANRTAPIQTTEVAQRIAAKTGETLRLLAPATPAHEGVVVVPTSGATRTISTTGCQLVFQHLSPRKLELAKSEHGRVLLALWDCGLDKLTTTQIKAATGAWPAHVLHDQAHRIPAWLYKAIAQANAPRKSVLIGLSGPYDWSSAQIRDDVLIGKVLQHHRFEDVVRLCAHYGMPKVRRVFRKTSLEAQSKRSVSRMLKNITKGFQLANGQSHAQT